MSTPKPKKARTDSTAPAPMGLALPTAQPATTTSAAPATTAAKPPPPVPTYPATAAQPVIDPALQNQASTSKVAQPSTGYLNSAAPTATTPGMGTYAYPNYYQGWYSQPGGTPYYYPAAYQQQYGATPIATPNSAHPYAPAAAPSAPAPTAPAASAAQQRLIPPPAPAARANAASTAAANAPSLDTSSVAQLTDALGSAGVDIRAEEEAMARDAPSAHVTMANANREDRSRKQNFLDPVVLNSKIKEITSNHSLTATPEAQTYIALALQSRLTSVLKQCITAVDHRIESTYTRPPPLYPLDENAIIADPEHPPEPLPMWSVLVRRDVAKQVAALEKIEREEETKTRRRRRERDENEAAGINGGTGGDMDIDGGDDEDEGKKKKKKKKEGPGVTAKNMSDEVRKKMSDMVANDFAGGFAKKYAWMSGGAGAASSAAAKSAAATGAGTSTPKPATTTAAPSTSTGGGFVRSFVTKPTVTVEPVDERRMTLPDIMFVVTRERGHGAGRGSARTWSVTGY